MSYIVEAGPFNGPDDLDAAMNWVDITPWVNDRLQAVGSDVGRQTELQAVQPGSLNLILNNGDGRFTPGNTLSPYYPGWRTGMRLRCREVLGVRSYTDFDGNMLQPDVTIRTPGIDQTVAVNATDRLGRLQTSRRFISTFGEWIMYNTSPTLRAYWSLGETGVSAWRDHVGGQPPLRALRNDSTLASQTSTPAVFAPGSGTGPPGDDRGGVLLTPSLVASGGINDVARSYRLVSALSQSAFPLQLHAATALTVVAWIKLDPAYEGTAQVANIRMGATTTVSLTRNLVPPAGSALWTANVFSVPAALSGSLSGPSDTGGRLMPVAIQMSYSPNSLVVWLDTLILTATAPTGTITDPQPLTNLQLGELGGSLSHVQIHIGNYTYAQYLNQRDAGMTGLAGQYTGQRITTLARYAGMSDGDLSIDPGTVRMQPGRLAGLDPLSPMQEAATTEQGLLHAAGRRLIFHDRHRRYNR